MPQRRRKFSPEFKAEAVRMVIEQSHPIAQVARDINVLEGTLGRWVADYRTEHAGEEPPPSITERAQLHELKKENAKLRMRNEFLGKAATLPIQAPAARANDAHATPPSHRRRRACRRNGA